MHRRDAIGWTSPLLCYQTHASDLAYLDSVAATQRAGCALQAQYDFDLHGNSNVYRGSYELSVKATAAPNDARRELESFNGAKRRETVSTASTSQACNLVALA